MKVVAILSEKGGAGKTTLAVHLATASVLAERAAVILDLDPQGSAYAWAQRRNAPPEAECIQPVALPSWLNKLRSAEASLVVLDTGRDANNAGYSAAKAADIILIPCRAGGFDFLALGRTLDLCRLAGKRPFVLLNAIRPGSLRAIEDARDLLADLECELVPMVLHERADFRAASMAAQSAQELDPTGKAAGEIEEVYKWVIQQLHNPATQQPKEAAR